MLVHQENFDSYRKMFKKSLYNIEVGGFKAYNNAEQTSNGQNGYKKEESDSFCKPRYQMVSVTALEEGASIDMVFSANDFMPYPNLELNLPPPPEEVKKEPIITRTCVIKSWFEESRS